MTRCNFPDLEPVFAGIRVQSPRQEHSGEKSAFSTESEVRRSLCALRGWQRKLGSSAQRSRGAKPGITVSVSGAFCAAPVSRFASSARFCAQEGCSQRVHKGCKWEGGGGGSFHLMLLLTAADRSFQTCSERFGCVSIRKWAALQTSPLVSFPRRLSDVMQVLRRICSELYVVIIILWVGSLPDPTSCCIIITDRRAQFQRAWKNSSKQEVCRTKHVMLGWKRQLKPFTISSLLEWEI